MTRAGRNGSPDSPRGSAGDRPAPRTYALDSSKEPDGRSHVVVAEDDTEMRRMLAEALREDGFEVTEIEDGAALRRFIESAGKVPRLPAADLLVSDIRMPGYDGLEVLEALRMSDWSLPVILITAFGDEETHEEALRLGAQKVFDKPFDLADLLTEVRGLLPAG